MQRRDRHRSKDLRTDVGKAASSWPLWSQALISLAILFHLAAVLVGCLAARPASDLEMKCYEVFRYYCDFLYQGVSYRYYSRLDTTTDPAHPRPWGTPIMLAEMEFDLPDGAIRRETLRLPDSIPTRPRLRHQRRIDLAYHLAVEPRWAASYARHIFKQYRCDRVTLFSQPHFIPDLPKLRSSSISDVSSWLDAEYGSNYGTRSYLGDFKCTEFWPK
jgi:hypothetical protein